MPTISTAPCQRLSGRGQIALGPPIAEKEIPGGPFYRDAVGVADNPVGSVLDETVLPDMADDPVGGILHRAVFLDVADDPVGGVLHEAVVLQVAHDPEFLVLDHAVGLDMADDPERGVLDRPVGFDMGNGPVSGIRDALRGCSGTGKEKAEEEKAQLHAGKLRLFGLFSNI